MILADLEVIKARCDAATPGIWERKETFVVCDGYLVAENAAWFDAEFIAHSREDVPAMVEAVERLLSMLTDAQTEAEMQASENAQLRALVDALERASR